MHPKSKLSTVQLYKKTKMLKTLATTSGLFFTRKKELCALHCVHCIVGYNPECSVAFCTLQNVIHAYRKYSSHAQYTQYKM